MPEIAPDVEQLLRLPAHAAVGDAAQRAAGDAARAAPLPRASRRLQRAVRGAIYAGRELLVLGFVKQPKGMKLIAKLASQHRERSLARTPS